MKTNNELEKWDRKARLFSRIGIIFFLLSFLLAGGYWFITSSVSALNVKESNKQYYLVLDDESVSEISPELYHQLGFIFWWFPKIIIGLFLLGSLFAGSISHAAGVRSLGKERWSEIRSKAWENPFKVWARAVTPRLSELKSQWIFVALVISFILIILYPVFFLPPPIEGSIIGSNLTAHRSIPNLLFIIAKKLPIFFSLTLIFTTLVVYTALFTWTTYKGYTIADLFLKAVEDET